MRYLRKVGIARWDLMVSKVLAVVAAICLFLMVFTGSADALLPTLFGIGFPGGFEVTIYLVVVVIWLSLPLLQVRGTHITVHIVTDRLPFKVTRWLDIITGSILMAIVYGAISWGYFEAAQFSWSVKEYWGEIRLLLPIYPLKMALVLATSLCAVICIATLVNRVTRFRQKK